MRFIATLILCLLAGVAFAQNTNKMSLANELVMLKTNGLSDRVILTYLRERAKETREVKPSAKAEKIDVESYEFFWQYYLLPRAAASRERMRHPGR